MPFPARRENSSETAAHPATLIPVDAFPTVDGEAPIWSRTSSGFPWQRGGPTGILIAGATATAVLIALSLLDAFGIGMFWATLHGTISVGTALVVTAIAWRGSTGDDRRIRAWIAVAAGIWTIARVVRTVEVVFHLNLVPSLAIYVLAATAIPLIGWLMASVDPRLGRTNRTSALLDIGAIIVAIAGILVVVLGATAETIGGPAGILEIAYPLIFFTGAGAVAVVALDGADRRSVPFATLTIAAGLVMTGLAGLLSLALQRSGTVSNDLVRTLFSIAPIAIAAGSTLQRQSLVRTRDPGTDTKRSLIPIATALVAAVVLIFADNRLDGITEVGVRLAISATIVLIVVRQTLLLQDRRAALARIHGATAQVEAAMTEARRAAQLLSAAEERFRRLVEQIPAAVYLDRIDRSTVTSDSVYISPRVKGLTGYTPEELAADRDLWDSRILRDDVAAVDLEWDRHVRDGVPFSVTYRFTARDGRTIWLAEDAEILAGPDEQAFSQGIIVDVTERRETEDRLRQAQKMEAVGQLAGGVAHDFNNLLTVITGHAELLLETTSDESSRVDLDAIAAAAASSAGLVGQLLAFGRRTMLRPEVTDLSSVVDEVMPMLRRLLPEHIEIEAKIRSDLPAVRVDPGQIQQVVLNLAINGRDAMPSGGRLRIETSAREIEPIEAARMLGCMPGSYVELSIADDGIGMDAATRDRIFEPFFTTKAAGRGTGLGLATVYGIVKQSGGYIALESAVNRGSTFRVLIPASGQTASSREADQPSRSPRGYERIVLCEDEAAVRDLVAAVLRRSGYDVVTATTPAEALLLVADRAAPADLLLSDVVMPGMSGPDLAQRARSLRPDLRIVLMSGYAPESLDRDAIGWDAAFLAKPFTPARLAHVVRNVLDGIAPEDGGLDSPQVRALA